MSGASPTPVSSANLPLPHVSASVPVPSPSICANGYQITSRSSLTSPLVHDSQPTPITPHFASTSFVTPAQSLSAVKHLQTLFGSGARFKSSEQRIAVERMLYTCEDQIVVLATGGGKSAIFFLYACANLDTTTLVIVPHLALIEDMLLHARKFGLSAQHGFFDQHSAQSYPSLIFATPESVTTEFNVLKVIDLWKSKQLKRIVIDEVHTFRTYFDFRPILAKLHFLSICAVPIIALTGTCSEETLRDVQHFLFGLSRHPALVRQSTNRDNLCYQVRVGNVPEFVALATAKFRTLSNVEKMVIFFTRVESVDEYYVQFQGLGVTCRPYHSEMSDEERSASLNDFMRSKVPICMLATSAFGLGVDAPSIRVVICFGLPYSMEDLVQQWGRAGRDGKYGECILIYSYKQTTGRLLAMSDKLQKTAELKRVLEFAVSGQCRRQCISSIFDTNPVLCVHFDPSLCQYCDVCEIAVDGFQSNLLPPHDLVTVNVNNNSAQSLGSDLSALMTSTTGFQRRLQAALRKFERTCIICFIRYGTQEMHKSAACPQIRDYGGCLCCLRTGHAAKFCPDKVALVPKGHCFKCFLPLEMNGFYFHEFEKFGPNCETQVADVLRYFVLIFTDGEEQISSWYRYSLLNPMALVLHEKFELFVNS